MSQQLEIGQVFIRLVVGVKTPLLPRGEITERLALVLKPTVCAACGIA
jgi:hypothetical protein